MWLRAAAVATAAVIAVELVFLPLSVLYAGLNLECVETQSCGFLGDPMTCLVSG